LLRGPENTPMILTIMYLTLHNSHIKTYPKKWEGRRRYCPCEIKRLTSYTRGQNAQNNMGICWGKKDHQYASHPKIKPHPKHAWQIP
jgi:hypothetical protein